MSKDFRQRLKDELQSDIDPSKAPIDQTIKLAQAAYGSRRKLKPISTFEMIIIQLRFVAHPIGLLQGIALLCVYVSLLSKGVRAICQRAVRFCQRLRSIRFNDCSADLRKVEKMQNA